MAFIEEHPDALITVVVDATFGHRIDKKEVKSFDDAVANNELVTPPAGAVGRGDAFVLSIANKAKAGILSNDSFQEFHGDYGWLFEPGRLIGGKPVPHVGWVFVERLPVRGPKSRQSVKDAKSVDSPDVDAATALAPDRRWRIGRCPSRRRRLPVPPPTAKAKVKRAAAETAAVVAAAAATVDNGAQQASRRIGQRSAAVPRLRRAPPGRHRMHGRRRELRLARGLRPLRRRARLRAAAADGRPAAAQRASGTQDRRGSGGRDRRLRPRAPQHRRRARVGRRRRRARRRSQRHPSRRRRRDVAAGAPSDGRAATQPTPGRAAPVSAASRRRRTSKATAEADARRATARGADRRRPCRPKRAPPSEPRRRGQAGHASSPPTVETAVTRRRPPSNRTGREAEAGPQTRRQEGRPAPRRRSPAGQAGQARRPTKPATRRRAAKAPHRAARSRRRQPAPKNRHAKRAAKPKAKEGSAVMRLVTWNVNSLARPAGADRGVAGGGASRMSSACRRRSSPTTPFRRLSFKALGYESAHFGQGQWNGVAILSRVGLEDVVANFSAGIEPDPDARIITATCGGVRVSSCYVPNGRALDDDHYTYKLSWLDRLQGPPRARHRTERRRRRRRRLQHRADRCRRVRPQQVRRGDARQRARALSGSLTCVAPTNFLGS